jgi:heme/copper-type cytochrome/quinol oxidase subunit 2
MKKTYIVLGVLVIIAGSLWWWVSFATPASTPTDTTLAAPAQKAFTLIVTGKKIVSGDTTLSVNQGDVVTITITDTDDATEELHLHGYDVHTDLTAGVASTLTFTASTTGRFPFELENSKTDLGAVEVNP